MGQDRGIFSGRSELPFDELSNAAGGHPGRLSRPGSVAESAQGMECRGEILTRDSPRGSRQRQAHAASKYERKTDTHAPEYNRMQPSVDAVSLIKLA